MYQIEECILIISNFLLDDVSILIYKRNKKKQELLFFYFSFLIFYDSFILFLFLKSRKNLIKIKKLIFYTVNPCLLALGQSKFQT